MKKYLLLFSLIFATGQAFGQEAVGQISLSGNLIIHGDAILHVTPGTKLLLSDTSMLIVKKGCVKLAGSETDSILITSNGNFNFMVETGGTVSATYTIIEKLDGDGLMIKDSAIVNLQNVHFRLGAASGTFITANNTNNKTFEQIKFTGTSNERSNGFLEVANVTKNNEQGSITFTNFSGNLAGSRFEADANNIVFWYDDTLNVIIPGGWSGLSSYVLPQTDLDTLFHPIIDSLIILQSQTGVYWPGENINTIGNWNTHDGYKIKLTGTIDFAIPGEYERQKTLELSHGWNLIPMLSECEVNVAGLFTIAGDTIVEVVKEVAGIGIYWPSQGINTLEALLPGKAYYVSMDNEGEIEFPDCGNLTGFKNLSGLSGYHTMMGLSPWKLSPPTPSTHNITIHPEATQDFEPGSILGVFDSDGNCNGLTLIEHNGIHLAAFGNDWFTGEKDGFFEDDQMHFRLFNPADGTQLDLQPVFDGSLPQSNGKFVKHGLTAINSFGYSLSAKVQSRTPPLRIYPNPTKGIVNITGLAAGAKVNITDSRGQLLMSLTTTADETFRIDLSTLQPGLYIINAETEGVHFVNRIILQQ